MEQFKVIEGKLSDKYNHFKDYEYTNCLVTNTRLMGVVAMRVLWKDPEDFRHQYEQIIHLDYSEYGIDEYFECEILSDEEHHGKDLAEAFDAWNSVSKDLGGETRYIDPTTMMKLIDDAIDVARNNIMQRYDEFADFRQTTLYRIELMRSTLVQKNLLAGPISTEEALRRVVPAVLSSYESINYFLMRLVDRDYPAAAHLSNLSIEELKKQQLCRPGISSLIRNSIGESETDEGAGYLYGAESIFSCGDNYYLSTSMIRLEGEPDSKNRKVTSIRTGFMKKLSKYETASMITFPEYITVYDIPDEVLADFEIRCVEMFELVTPKMVNNGWMLPLYRPDNSHVDKAIYNISGDIIGSGLVSIPGEFIIMSHRLMDANAIEKSIEESPYGERFILKGRYHVKESVFQTICQTTGSMFEDFVVPKNLD